MKIKDYYSNFRVILKKIHLVFFVVLFITIICPASLRGSERIDIDYKFKTGSISEFYLLSDFFSDKQVISIKEKKFNIKESSKEFFIDYYYDTPSFSLYKDRKSLRFRHRFVNGKLLKRLVQFKKSVEGNLEGKYEYKIKINKDITFSDPKDLISFMKLPQNSKKELVQQVKSIINVDYLKTALILSQIRRRFYFHDEKGIPYFTLTFDEIYPEKGMKYMPFYEIEFEINEKLAGQSSQEELNSLKNRVFDLIKMVESTDIAIDKITKSKYERSLEAFDINISRKLFVPKYLILVFAIIFSFAFIIFTKKTALFKRKE